MKYFAYGSNKYTPRLRYRVASCDFVTTAKLVGHQLRFHKRSKDGSSKCNIFGTGLETDFVWGVVFDIAETEKRALDQAEGLGAGYNDEIISVTTLNGEKIEVVTYIADAKAIVEDLAPFTWYKDFVANGAAEHGLPPEYVLAVITRVEAVEDPKPERERDERAKVRH